MEEGLEKREVRNEEKKRREGIATRRVVGCEWRRKKLGDGGGDGGDDGA